MSEHDPHEHQSFIKTPTQLLVVVVLAFVIPIGLIAMLASLVTSGSGSDPGTLSEEAIRARLKPIGEVHIAEGAAGDAAAALRSGKEISDATCAACHATGVLNAPKIGDTAAWAPHIKEGLEALTQNAIKGIRAMPPRGGNPDLSDIEVARAVAYIANQSGANFTEPSAPAAQAGAPAQTAQPAAPGAAPTVAGAAPAALGGSPAPAAPAGGDAAKGKTVYDSSCVACHGSGLAGAPKLGDKAAWAPRLKQGMDALYQASIKGKGAMPPKGGNMALSDGDVKSAVDFMAAESK